MYKKASFFGIKKVTDLYQIPTLLRFVVCRFAISTACNMKLECSIQLPVRIADTLPPSWADYLKILGTSTT